MNRLCIPLSTACNLRCAYCYRDSCRHSVPTTPTAAFRDYLRHIPDSVYAVVMSGGEPLLQWDMIRYIVSLVPSHVHKKVMTNGILLTENVVKYFNDHDVEVHVSHDGSYTKALRGVDILEEKVPLLQQIRYLRIVPVITNRNEDVLEIYQYLQERIGRPFYMEPSVIIPTGCNDELVKGFDYDTYQRSMIELLAVREAIPADWYRMPSGMGLNTLLNGDVVGMNTLIKYGTVWDDRETIERNFKRLEPGYHYCMWAPCTIKETCRINKANACDHVCRIARINHAVREYGYE